MEGRPLLHLFIAGIVAAIVWSAVQTIILNPVENAIGA